MTTTKMHIIDVWGKTWFGVDSAEEYIRDMLRYDEGTIFSIQQEGVEFEAIVVSKRYTPARWTSFGICTEEIECRDDITFRHVLKQVQDIHLSDVQTWVDNSKLVKIIS